VDAFFYKVRFRSVSAEKSKLPLAPAKLTPGPSLRIDCEYAYDPKKERGAVCIFPKKKSQICVYRKSKLPSLQKITLVRISLNKKRGDGGELSERAKERPGGVTSRSSLTELSSFHKYPIPE